jgi:hypothetical protein
MIAQIHIHIPLLPILIAGPVLCLLFLASLPWLARRTDFISITRGHLRRFAPLYFVVGPSALTYFAFCGTVSAIAASLFINTHGYTLYDVPRDYIIQRGIFTMFHWIEYASSFLGAYAFARLLRWVGLSSVWIGISVVSLSVSAAYRTARLDPGPNFGSGPQILLSPEWLDAVPVILGLGLFLLQRTGPNHALQRTAPRVTVAASSSSDPSRPSDRSS